MLCLLPAAQVTTDPSKQAGFPCLIHVLTDSGRLSGMTGFGAKDTDIPPGHYQGPSTGADSNLCNKEDLRLAVDISLGARPGRALANELGYLKK